MRVRHKLVLILAVWALIGSVLVGAGAVWLLRSAVRDSVAERVEAETALLAEWIRTHDREDPQAVAVQAAGRLGVRVTLIAADGTVLGDSAKGRSGVVAMDNHRTRPEIQQALRIGSGISLRRSATTTEEYLYTARLVTGEGPVKFVRIAVPSSQIELRQGRYSWLVTGVVLVAMLMVTALTYGAVRRLSKPVERMSEVAERNADGEFTLEVPQGGQDEVARLGTAIHRMKRALVEKIDELAGERALLSSVISGMREGLLVVGPDRKIRLANEAVRQIFDLRFDPVDHRLAEVVRHPEVIREVDHVITAGQEVRESPVRLEGSGRTFELHITPLSRDPSGEAFTVLVLFFDITRLEALEGVRRNFVANVSHELRTPLTSIKAFVETLIEGGLQDREHSLKFLRIAHKHADRMNALIDDLTDLSLIETGAITLDLGVLDASEVAREVVEQLQPHAADAGVEIEVAIPRPFPIRADRRRLEQMLMNLVDNAIKFNRPGGTVRLIGSREDDRPHLTVEDTGIGIPADSTEKVFHRFYRVDAERSRRVGGTGLGLAIVKHLVRLHGGVVRVESELGRGTRFILEFPRVEPEILAENG